MSKVLITAFFIVCSFYNICVSNELSSKAQINICVLEKVNKAVLLNLSSSEVILQINNKKFLLRGSNIKIEFKGHNKVKINDLIYDLPVYIRYKKQKDTCELNGQIYPLNFKIYTLDNKSLIFVNIVDIETYVEGVLPYEVVSSWSDEMLKVQAVIVRTYALANINRHKEDGYDLCNNIHCQVYKGFSKNELMRKRVEKAVKKTKGMVLVEPKTKKLIQTYYHAACGGATEDMSEIWHSTIQVPWLVSVKCDFCRKSPYYKWSYSISQEDFCSVLRKNGYNLTKKTNKINVVDKTKGGRIKNVEIISLDSKFKIGMEELRKILGYQKLKSTKIYKIEVTPKTITFYGLGWGHGVGLCQWGANELTNLGKSFKEVLEYYYPNTKIIKIYE